MINRTVIERNSTLAKPYYMNKIYFTKVKVIKSHKIKAHMQNLKQIFADKNSKMQGMTHTRAKKTSINKY